MTVKGVAHEQLAAFPQERVCKHGSKDVIVRKERPHTERIYRLVAPGRELEETEQGLEGVPVCITSPFTENMPGNLFLGNTLHDVGRHLSAQGICRRYLVHNRDKGIFVQIAQLGMSEKCRCHLFPVTQVAQHGMLYVEVDKPVLQFLKELEPTERSKSAEVHIHTVLDHAVQSTGIRHHFPVSLFGYLRTFLLVLCHAQLVADNLLLVLHLVEEVVVKFLLHLQSGYGSKQVLLELEHFFPEGFVLGPFIERLDKPIR